jgi:hypothetical protein
LHGNGRHLLPELAQLSGFVHVSICDDGARVRAFDDRKNIHRTAKDLLISIACGKDEFMRAMRDRSLVPARYAVGGCETLQEATRLLERFRNCRM